jgi:tetratricopeptide (TPR) repeat protein
MAEISNSLGIVLLREGKLDRARGQFEQAMRARAAAGVPEGLADAETLHNIAVICLMKYKYTEAESAFLKSLEIRTYRQGSSHPDLTLTLIALGQTYTAMGRYEEAARQFEHGLTILRGLDTPFPERMVRILGLAGSNYSSKAICGLPPVQFRKLSTFTVQRL